MHFLVLAIAVLGPAAASDSGDTGNVIEARVSTAYTCSTRSLTQVPRDPTLQLYNPKAAYGQPAMVDLIVETSKTMARWFPQAGPLYVGEISSRWGGELEGHRTHRRGRDADIGLYQRDDQMLSVLRNPTVSGFDEDANWALITMLLDSGSVESILLDQAWIDRLETYAREVEGVSEERLREIFPGKMPANPSGVVVHTSGHRNHMHVRIYCGVAQASS